MPSADKNTSCWEAGGKKAGAGEKWKKQGDREEGEKHQKREKREREERERWMEEDGEGARKEEREREVKRYKNVKCYWQLICDDDSYL